MTAPGPYLYRVVKAGVNWRSPFRLFGAGEASFVVFDVEFGGDALDGLCEDVEIKVGEFFEADAGFALVEFLAGFGPFGFEPGGVCAVGSDIEGHEVDGHVVFLGGEAGEGEWVFGITVVTGGIDGVRDAVADHAVGHFFLVGGVEVGENDGADGGDDFAAVGGEFGEIFFNGGGGTGHGYGVYHN